MPFSLEYDSKLNIYKLNNRPLDLTSFARAAVAHIALLEARIRALEEEAFEVVKAEPSNPIASGLTISTADAAEEPIAIQDEASALEPSPPGYKRTRKKKNKSKEQS